MTMQDFTQALDAYKSCVKGNAPPQERYNAALALEGLRSEKGSKISQMCKEHDIDPNKYRHDVTDGKKSKQKYLSHIEVARQEFVKYGNILLKEDICFVADEVKKVLEEIMTNMPDNILDNDTHRDYFDGLMCQMERLGVFETV